MFIDSTDSKLWTELLWMKRNDHHEPKKQRDDDYPSRLNPLGKGFCKRFEERILMLKTDQLASTKKVVVSDPSALAYTLLKIVHGEWV